MKNETGVKQESDLADPIHSSSNPNLSSTTDPNPQTTPNLSSTTSNPSTTNTNEPGTMSNLAVHTTNTNPPPTTDDDDASSTASDPDIPPALITGDTYDALICGQCVLKNPTVRKYVGTPGARIVVPDPNGTWRVLGTGGEGDQEAVVDVGHGRILDAGQGRTAQTGEQSHISDAGQSHTLDAGEAHAANARQDTAVVAGVTDRPEGTVEVGTKRRASTDAVQPTKRARPEQGSASAGCLAPPINLEAQQVLDDLEKLDIKNEDGQKPGPGRTRRAMGDVFLSEGWRDRWCRCETVRTLLCILISLQYSLLALPFVRFDYAESLILYSLAPGSGLLSLFVRDTIPISILTRPFTRSVILRCSCTPTSFTRKKPTSLLRIRMPACH